MVALPQVTSWGPGPVSLPGAFISCGYFPGELVGPLMALAQALTLPTISTPQCPRSGAISYVILARSTPRSCSCRTTRLRCANSECRSSGSPIERGIDDYSTSAGGVGKPAAGRSELRNPTGRPGDRVHPGHKLGSGA